MRICFFGDSFVHGTGDDDCLGWPGRLCAAARRGGRDVTLYNLGVRRDRSADVARRWEAETVARLLPKHQGRLVFSFGTNDCVEKKRRPRLTEVESIAHTRSILSRAQQLWPVLMIGPPRTGVADLDARLEPLAAAQSQLCDELRIPYFDVFRLVTDWEVWHRETAEGDGIHPGPGGYAMLAEAVAAWQPWRDWLA